MMMANLNRVLIESAVRKALRDIDESPERGVRNLVDLALDFSNGRFQRTFLEMARQMLKNEKSAYFSAMKQMVSGVEWDNIVGFGINVGYNSFTKGARIIRETEEAEGFNIPWALTFSVRTFEEKHRSLIEQGKKLGIYTYFIFADQPDEALLHTIKQCQDCAFVLLTDGSAITDSLLALCEGVNNLMFSVGEHMAEGCRQLKAHRKLYSVYCVYGKQEQTVYETWLEAAADLGAVCAMFLYGGDHAADAYDYVVEVRKSQRLAVFPMDFRRDNMFIDSIISDDPCSAAFDLDGNLVTGEYRVCRALNGYDMPLREVFRQAFPK